ncbi:KpsF/GutQ family sugar-phosphate isomerase [Rhizorhabdus dicambivorans]|uniref:KpsF/GutQ family sugar-phosphate isomerase n=1 Tax=Rhizorhabdus dicambivorans TaxID=1850238 RepID=A0A2A4FY65_9SPHN|nr:KpsF/GutQ family sugar-phosphate isomerase [Rhizorhabdus dicambivorans]ATE66034.1 KpsF/GutQ family sugar-phosphate isomerase [Rhizorhabdus dicambivorans]PCE43153.1 KpsF/GutQ family sugar-phosphate isomerase [Rhizorhabdus dicambivorans]
MYHHLLLKPDRAASTTRAAILDHGRTVLEVESQALALLRDVLDEEFADAVELILATRGRVVVSGMGKSGHIARKMAATFASTGTPAIFVHPGEAAHGDLGMLLAGDLLVLLSNSGATPELRPIMDYAQSLACPIVAISSQRHSPMAQAARAAIILPAVREACPANISPTASTTLMLALGDALAVATMSVRGITRQQLERLHPGGAIGLRLLPINEIMHSGDQLPLVTAGAPMRDVLVTMTEKSLGIAGVMDEEGRLIGTITDGDLRRNIDRLLLSNAADVMTRHPKTIPDGTYAEDALAMMSANKITALFVMDHATPERPVGLVHIHDFSRMGVG